MIKKKDRELLDELEALGEIIEWLENSERCYPGQTPESIAVDEHELEQWLKTPSLAQARSWLKR